MALQTLQPTTNLKLYSTVKKKSVFCYITLRLKHSLFMNNVIVKMLL